MRKHRFRGKGLLFQRLVQRWQRRETAAQGGERRRKARAQSQSTAEVCTRGRATWQLPVGRRSRGGPREKHGCTVDRRVDTCHLRIGRLSCARYTVHGVVTSGSVPGMVAGSGVRARVGALTPVSAVGRVTRQLRGGPRVATCRVVDDSGAHSKGM